MPTHRLAYAALGALALLGCALYLPFLGNPSFFDDRYLFSGYRFAEYALSPFGLGLRHPSYFSLAFVQTVFGSIEAQRLASLAFHVACAWALYGLIRELQQGASPGAPPASQRAAAFGAAALFAVHPVAVYAAGYLVQRSIVLATLFGLLSLALFLRGLRRRSYADAVSAGALYALAVLCKEHAILLPAAAIPAAFLLRPGIGFSLRGTAAYWAACFPAALLVTLIAGGIIGERYEPDFNEVAAQITQQHWTDVAEQPWLGSSIAQASLFFRYLGLWLVPRTAGMALDIRIDFAETWSPGMALPATAGFVAFAVVGGWLLARRGRAGMAGFGLLYLWLMFLLEFSVVRFQEPFVLYRSYLWAPGLAIALAAALERLPWKPLLAGCAAAALLLSVQSWDRLRSMSSGLALWEDAAGKLPAEPIPGGWRTLYSLGREYLYADMPKQALAVTERCLVQYPGTYHCYFARAAVYMHLEQYDAAIPYILKAIAARPAEGVARHHLGVVMEELGCRDQARSLYELSYKLGFTGARFRLETFDSPGRGLLPPKVLARRSQPCAAPPIPARAFLAP